MNVTMETPSDPEGLVTGNLLSHYMAPYVIFGLTVVFRLRTSIYKQIAYLMISEFWTFGLQNLFVRTREPFFTNLRTFGLKNLRTHELSNLRTFGLMGCNHSKWCIPCTCAMQCSQIWLELQCLCFQNILKLILCITGEPFAHQIPPSDVYSP